MSSCHTSILQSVSDPSQFLRHGHLYIGARRGWWGTDWKQARFTPHVYFRYTPCLTNFTFEFIRRPISPILSPSSRTFAKLTLITRGFIRAHSISMRPLIFLLVCFYGNGRWLKFWLCPRMVLPSLVICTNTNLVHPSRLANPITGD
jgi:hypothetical protein